MFNVIQYISKQIGFFFSDTIPEETDGTSQSDEQQHHLVAPEGSKLQPESVDLSVLQSMPEHIRDLMSGRPPPGAKPHDKTIYIIQCALSGK